jgi:hypothetical protein
MSMRFLRCLTSNFALADGVDDRVAETNRMQATLPSGAPLIPVTLGPKPLALIGEPINRSSDPDRQAIVALELD